MRTVLPPFSMSYIREKRELTWDTKTQPFSVQSALTRYPPLDSYRLMSLCSTHYDKHIGKRLCTSTATGHRHSRED